jgi:hypothetical protein
MAKREKTLKVKTLKKPLMEAGFKPSVDEVEKRESFYFIPSEIEMTRNSELSEMKKTIHKPLLLSKKKVRYSGHSKSGSVTSIPESIASKLLTALILTDKPLTAKELHEKAKEYGVTSSYNATQALLTMLKKALPKELIVGKQRPAKMSLTSTRLEDIPVLYEKFLARMRNQYAEKKEKKEKKTEVKEEGLEIKTSGSVVELQELFKKLKGIEISGNLDISLKLKHE